MLQRSHWTCLNGPWDFHIGSPDSKDASHPVDIAWGRTILVPYAPETPASGIGDTSEIATCWYRRTFAAPPMGKTDRLILHFGAVDYGASVWVNGQLAARHEGGYTPFWADITDLLSSDEQEIIVRADDDPHDMTKPRGKQDWLPQPHSIWYARTTGIWQTVWLEVVPARRIANLKWTPNVERWEIGLEAGIAGIGSAAVTLRVVLRLGEGVLADDRFSVIAGEVNRAIGLPNPAIDNGRDELFWRPGSPKLIDAELTLLDAEGNVVDHVRSYCGLRAVRYSQGRFELNGSPHYLRLALDQGYWPDTGLTAPDDAALRRDVELALAMGFNGVRKHQKIENPRYLYWADRLGLLVWEEMPSCYRFSSKSMQRLTTQWAEAIARDVSHPCIVAWVPINESWGIAEVAGAAQQREAMHALYHLTKSLDPTRPVVGNDGWEFDDRTDLVCVHDYNSDPHYFTRVYDVQGPAIEALLQRAWPNGHRLLLPDASYENQPVIMSEFGGIAFSPDLSHTWGYSRAPDASTFARKYLELLTAVRSVPLFSGFCYTQFTDTYQEANGLLYMDRTPKFPIEQIAVATRGATNPRESEIEQEIRGLAKKPRLKKN
jgi:hypothetical protein